MIKLRFLLAYGGYPKGFVIEPPAALRQQLLATRWYGRPVVEAVEEATPVPEPMPAGVSDRKRKRVPQ